MTALDLTTTLSVLARVESFDVSAADSGGRTVARRRQRDGRTLWSVAIGNHVAQRDGTVEYEPLPSERDDDFIARTRFSADDACDVALRIIGVDPAKVAQVRTVLRAIAAPEGSTP